MKKNTSKEAFYNRLQQLAEVNEFKKANSGLRNIGTLIDFKRSADGVAFGIVKENHHYYIKKGGLKEDLDASDFTYLDGLENITSYQYKTISEADKQRNALLNVINNSSKVKINVKGSKMVLNENCETNEDVAKDELDNAENKFADLSAATDAKRNFPTAPEQPVDTGSEPQGDLPAVDTAAPEDLGGAPEDLGGAPEDLGGDPEGSAPEGDAGDQASSESQVNANAIEKTIGKLGIVVRKTKLTPEQTETFVKELLAPFKEKLKEIDADKREEISDEYIVGVQKDDLQSDLESSITDDLEEVINNGDDYNPDNENSGCNECGGFVKYAESRGYGKKSIMEGDDAEVASLISGYANAYNEGLNHGDAKTVSLFINNKINEMLVKEYGHSKYFTEILKPQIKTLNESTEEDKDSQINKLPWEKNNDEDDVEKTDEKPDGKMLKEEVKRQIKKLMKNFGQGVAKKMAKKFGNKVLEEGADVDDVKVVAEQFAKKVVKKFMKDYGKGTAKKIAGEFGNKILEEGDETEALNEKAIVKSIASKVAKKHVKRFMKDFGKGTAKKIAGEFGNKIIKEAVENDADDVDAVDADTDYAPEDTKSPFANDTQTLGVVTPSLGGTSTGDIDIDVDSDTKKINIAISEVKRQIGHLGKRLNELSMGLSKRAKKPSAGLSKEKKSEVVKAAKKGEDIGKKGKGFEKVEKAAEKGGAKDPKAVAAAAMWKNVPRKGKAVKEAVSESEVKLRKYIKNRLMEVAGLKKESLNESIKSDKVKQLDNLISKQYNEYKKIVAK